MLQEGARVIILDNSHSYDGVLTGENCIFTVGKGTCNGCPIAEEAENGTSSFNRP